VQGQNAMPVDPIRQWKTPRTSKKKVCVGAASGRSGRQKGMLGREETDSLIREIALRGKKSFRGSPSD